MPTVCSLTIPSIPCLSADESWTHTHTVNRFSLLFLTHSAYSDIEEHNFDLPSPGKNCVTRQVVAAKIIRTRCDYVHEVPLGDVWCAVNARRTIVTVFNA